MASSSSAAAMGALAAPPVCAPELARISKLAWRPCNVSVGSWAAMGVHGQFGGVTVGKKGARGVMQVRAGVASASKMDTMQYRKLGDSELVISEVTLGTMTWGNQNSEKEAHEQLSYAFENGVNIFDSAESYPVPMTKESQGQTDRFISTWLKSMPRDKVIVATKVAGYSERSTYLRDSGNIVRVNEENITESVEKSLKRLGTDHIDLLQIHWPDRYVPLFGEKLFDPKKVRDSVPIVDQLKALKKVIDQGKVRYVGVSNETSWGVMEFAAAAKQLNLPKIISIQNSYSLLVRTQFEVDLLEVCLPQNCNVGLLAYSPLAGGALTGKYLSLDAASRPGRFNFFPGYMARYNKSLAREAVSAYVEVAKKHNMTPVELALGFCRDRSFMTSTIIGATSLEQLKENMNAFATTRPFPEEVSADIEETFKKYRDPAFT